MAAEVSSQANATAQEVNQFAFRGENMLATERPLPAESFARLLIASLTLRGACEIDLGSRKDRESLGRLVDEIEKIITEQLQAQPLSRMVKDLIRIHNQISPSDSGAFDGFEELITAQQYWIVSRYNPSLDKIKLSIHPEIAQHLLNRASSEVQIILSRIIGVFLNQAPEH